jgi:type I restriction enzyme S subunit
VTLPTGWIKVPLSGVCRVVEGQVDPRDPEYRDLPHINGEVIESGTGRLLDVRTAAEDGLISGKYLFEPGMVLYSKLRPYLRKVTIAPCRGVCSADMYPLMFDPLKVDTQFAMFSLLAEPFSRYAVAESRRARMPKLNRAQLLAWEMPLPESVDVQRRIAADLVEQLAAADAARRAAVDRLTAAERLPSAFLRGAFEQRAYPSRALREVSRTITDGTHLPPPFTESGIPFLFVRNIVGGSISFEVEKYISKETYEALTKKHKPERGDVLFSAVGSFGVAAVVQTDSKFAFQRHIAHIKTDFAQLDPTFLAHFLNSPKGRSQSEAVAVGGAQKTVTLADIRKFQIPVPPLNEQRRVVAELEQRLDGVNRLVKSCREELAMTDAVAASLIRTAFGGDR